MVIAIFILCVFLVAHIIALGIIFSMLVTIESRIIQLSLQQQAGAITDDEADYIETENRGGLYFLKEK
jgi:hypothetical protein